jgi:hypothetical protein
MQKASVMVSHIHCDCQALGKLRFRQLGELFIQPGDYEDISVSMIPHIVQSGGGEAPKCMTIRDAQKILYGHCSACLSCILFYSTLFYSWHFVPRVGQLNA